MRSCWPCHLPRARNATRLSTKTTANHDAGALLSAIRPSHAPSTWRVCEPTKRQQLCPEDCRRRTREPRSLRQWRRRWLRRPPHQRPTPQQRASNPKHRSPSHKRSAHAHSAGMRLLAGWARAWRHTSTQSTRQHDARPWTRRQCWPLALRFAPPAWRPCRTRMQGEMRTRGKGAARLFPETRASNKQTSGGASSWTPEVQHHHNHNNKHHTTKATNEQQPLIWSTSTMETSLRSAPPATDTFRATTGKHGSKRFWGMFCEGTAQTALRDE